MGNIRAQNASTALGLMWWVLNPLLLGLVYFFIFGVIFPIGRDISYLMSGMFVFHFTSHSLTGGAKSILGNSQLLANLRFPRLILPIANLLESSVGFLVSLLVLYGIVGVSGGFAGFPQVWLFPVIFAFQFLFNLGLAAIAARLAVPFRDINNFIPYFNRVWLYLSPIIWPLSRLDGLSDPIVRLIEANPMYSIISVYRSALLGYEFDASALMVAAVWALAMASIGVAVFVRSEKTMVRYL